jgi:hypothetical protein
MMDGACLSAAFSVAKEQKVLQFSSKFVNLKRKQMVLHTILCKPLNVSTVKLLRLIDSSGENKSRLCYCISLTYTAIAFCKHILLLKVYA